MTTRQRFSYKGLAHWGLLGLSLTVLAFAVPSLALASEGKPKSKAIEKVNSVKTEAVKKVAGKTDSEGGHKKSVDRKASDKSDDKSDNRKNSVKSDDKTSSKSGADDRTGDKKVVDRKTANNKTSSHSKADKDDADNDKVTSGKSKSKKSIADKDDTAEKSDKALKAGKHNKADKLADASDQTDASEDTTAKKFDKSSGKGKTSSKSKLATKLANVSDSEDDDLADSKPVHKGKTKKLNAREKRAQARALAEAEKPIKLTPVYMPPINNPGPMPYRMVVGQSIPATPVTMTLAPWDIQYYRAAYELIDQGDFTGAEAQLTLVTDKSLVGYAEYHKLFSLSYTASYEELTSWLSQYGELPVAMRVWNLAKRKKPEGAPDPAFPSLNGAPQQALSPDNAAIRLNARTTLSGSTTLDDPDEVAPAIDPVDSDLTPKSARSAYNNGQLEQAYNLGRKIGDHWVAGLASWRLKRYDQALVEFKFVSTDPSRNAWSQSAGAYWAGRCADRLNQADDAGTYFKIAASFPFTFYGLLAEARLGVTPAIALAKKGQAPTYSDEQRGALTASLTDNFDWVKTNPRAVRLNALIQIGRSADAREELQEAVQRANGGEERDRWLALAVKTHISVNQLKPNDRLFDSTIYPIPDFAPKDGFKVEKALIFAFARKESKFDPKAHSYSGAYGLLQLMPGTAALVENDPSFNSKPKQLLTPSINLRVGQKYIQRLFDSNIVSNDLLRTIAAYNAGPRPVKDALDSVGGDADSLLVMESIPVAQTRQYVEEVAANYWIYRQIMDEPSQTLTMAATDAKIIDATADK